MSIEKILQVILLSAFFFISSLKKVLDNRLICRVFHDSLASSFGRPALWRRLQRPHSGVILLLFALFVPIIVGGIKYTEYLFERRSKLIEAPGPIQKKCAAEAALAVAQNWNPDLTLAQQQEAVYKIADAIYNSIPAEQTSVLGAAIPGLKGTQDYGAITTEKIVPYKSATCYIKTYTSSQSTNNHHFELWRDIDQLTDNGTTKFYETTAVIERNCSLVPKDLCLNQLINSNGGNASTTYSYATYDSSSGDSSGATYTVRDQTIGEKPVIIDIDNDKIRVTTDSQTACATPAECNVDIVLAIPVNSRACSTSTNSDSSYSYSAWNDTTKANIEKTAIYQMGQACRAFIKDNFLHTRGVYMGLIPYSGKFSLSPQRYADWTTAIPAFQHPSGSDQYDVPIYKLYGSIGESGMDLATSYDDAGSDSRAYPIMCSASGLWDRHYRRWNPKPCTSLDFPNPRTCSSNCTTYLPNPYYMIEPTADLRKIYEMCGSLIPIYDNYNRSNFIFAALEWSNNFLAESWTADPGRTAVSGREETATLSCQSKTTANRKKAVILLVNKPDTFEYNELTYLGMASDAAERYQTERGEVTEYEYARISGNLEYKDDYYGAYDEKNSKTGTLTVSHKGDLSIYIEPIDYAHTTHQLENCYIHCVNLGKKNGIDAIIATGYDYSDPDYYNSTLGDHWLYSYDGINFLSFARSSNANIIQCCYVDGIFLADINSTGYYLRRSDDALNWTLTSTSVENPYDTKYGNGIFMSTASSNYDSTSNAFHLYAYTSADGRTWTKKGSIFSDGMCVFSDSMITYGNGKWVCIDFKYGQVCESGDNGQTWTNHKDLSIGDFRRFDGLTYGSGYFWIYVDDGYSVGSIYKSQDGANWTQVFRFYMCPYIGMCFLKNKLYCYDGNNVYVYDASVPEPWVKFTSCSTNICNQNAQYNLLTERDYSTRYFTIDSSKFPAPNSNGEYEINLEMLAAKINYASLSYTYYDDTLVTRTRNQQNKIIGSVYDSNLQNLTNNACTKLKNSGVRVYVIGYRYSSSDLPSYLKNCATNSGGKSYAITTEEDLKTILNEIAAEIKTWGGYQEARLVN